MDWKEHKNVCQEVEINKYLFPWDDSMNLGPGIYMPTKITTKEKAKVVWKLIRTNH